MKEEMMKEKGKMKDQGQMEERRKRSSKEEGRNGEKTIEEMGG